MKTIALAFLLAVFSGSCVAQFSYYYDSYVTRSQDSNNNLSQTVLVDGTTYGSCYLNGGTYYVPNCPANHDPSIYNVLGSAGGAYYGPSQDMFSYISYQVTVTIAAVFGEEYTDDTDADVYCEAAGYDIFGSGSSGSTSLSDPTPVITSVSANPLPAGESQTFHIYGSGFGTNPSLRISDPANAIVVLGAPEPINDGEVDVPVNVSGNAPVENATVSVTSGGYAGQAFFTTQGNSPVSNTFTFPVAPVPPVTITAPVGIPVGSGVGNFQVNIGSNPQLLSITLKLTTTSGTGDATFVSGNHQTFLVGSATVPLNGTTVSSTANNLTMQALDPNNDVLATAQFSVVWVTLGLRSGAGLKPSQNDSAAGEYQTKLGTPYLGPFSYNPLHGCFTGVELSGTVQPSNYTGKVVLRRTLLAKASFKNSELNGEDTTPSDDTSDPNIRDDNPQTSGGASYDLDAPGSNPGSGIDTWRVRQNFSEYAVLDSATNNTPVSAPFAYYSAVSCTTPDFENYSLVNDIPGDNQAGVGSVNLTYNLQPN